MTIKQGALVKAWDDDPSDYVIGELEEVDSNNKFEPFLVRFGKYDIFKNAIEIPPELAKALEELGR